MKVKPESRDKLKDGVDRRKRKLDKCEKHMKKVVKDKKEITDVSRKLRYPTKEGAAEIKPALKKAEVVCLKEFEKQEKDLKKKYRECKELEYDFNMRTRQAILGAYYTRMTKTKVESPTEFMSLLADVEKVFEYDVHFTEDLQRKLKRDRERSEKNCNVLRKIIRRGVTILGDAS